MHENSGSFTSFHSSFFQHRLFSLFNFYFISPIPSRAGGQMLAASEMWALWSIAHPSSFKDKISIIYETLHRAHWSAQARNPIRFCLRLFGAPGEIKSYGREESAWSESGVDRLMKNESHTWWGEEMRKKRADSKPAWVHDPISRLQDSVGISSH